MKTAKTTPPAKSTHSAFPLLLAIILSVLFWKSFLPDYVHFSNDGPLGEINAAWSKIPGVFTGSWDDLNDIGSGAGAVAPDISALISGCLGPVGYSKFLAPIALFILGIGAWTFFRQLKLSPLAATLGALATALDSSFFATACWGVAPQQIAMGMIFFALALVMANSAETPRLICLLRLALAGLCVGISVMEGADNGAIFSLFVAAFVFFKSLNEEGSPVLKKIGRGVGRVAVIAVFAGFIATQSIVSLIGFAITGVAGMGQDTMTKEQHWDYATQWSEPKIETLGLFVPGLFGYRMDTPKDMMGFLQDSYKGGEYWGGVGRDPAIDRYFESGKKSSPPPGIMRFTGGGNYVGILVALIALWTIVQSLRRQNSIFPQTQRRFVWFWTAALIISLLLAWGRFAPFFKLVYMLPYASTMRNPTKFLAVFSLAIVIIFAYGIDALSRCYLKVPSGKSNSTLKNWWATVRGFDRKWTLFCVAAFIVSMLGWFIYAVQKTNLIGYLQTVGFGADSAKEIAAFSIGQVGWFILFFALAIGLVILVLAGFFSGKRARLGGFLLGALLVADLGRADLPYIIHWNYKEKYASNPIIDLLRNKPYEHRVADLRSNSLFEELYRIEWMQHHFPYYNIQCLDVIQMPRMASDLEAYDRALTPSGNDADYLVVRRWQLTNTRYFLGPAGYLNSVNDELDPVQHRFRIIQRFNVVPKPGIEQPTELEQLTAVPDDNGEYALFEFTGALPRAAVYSNWQVITNDDATLKMLADKNFNPEKTVLVSANLPSAPAANSTNANAGTVEFKPYDPKWKKNALWKKNGFCYSPKDIAFDANATAPSVLLLNDKFDPDWRVTVDGKPAELLRCNYIMRGVYLTPGAHTVEFRFSLPIKPLYVTCAAWVIGFILLGVLIFLTRRKACSRRMKPI